MITKSATRPRALRWTGRAVLAILVLWLVTSSVHQLITGDYWFGGIPNPLPPLLFFAGPPLVLTALVLLALSRTRLSRMDRWLLSGSIALVLLVVLHLILSGRTWLWVLPDLMPPVLFVLMPLALLITLAVLWFRRVLRSPRVGATAAVLTAAALALGIGESGINLAAVTGGAADGPAPPGALHVVSWDTLEWNSGQDGFYEFLTERHADVYLLQSYVHSGPDDERLRRAFPGYQFASVGKLLTISRFPIVAQVPLETNPVQPPGTENIWFLRGWTHGALRTDLDVGGRILSVYNAFFYDRYFLHAMPLTPAFFADIRGLDEGRRQQVDGLLADVAANPHPVLIAGNLNLLPNTGDRARFDGFKDAGSADGSLYPVSLTFFGLPLWRMDWIFTSADVGIHHYDLVSPNGLSSRHLQDAIVSLHPE